MTDRKIVTRFAPSPTGYLHIGGARTALFNWAFARKHGGTFILRIEDTDAARSTPQATRGIIQDMVWLGIDWDEGPAYDPNDVEDAYDLEKQKGNFRPYFQSQRKDFYNQYIDQLLSGGQAYQDAGSVRFKMPRKDITVHDLVLGDVTTPADKIEDLVIRKSDGFPTFHFANVIDDATMKVTHVIRAQEHLNNTHKHLAIFEALGLQPPQYAHIPLIFNADGSKMSKRDKAKTARLAAKKRISETNETDFVDLCLKYIAVHYAGLFMATDIKRFLDKQSDELLIAQTIGQVLNIKLPEIDVTDFRRNGYLPQVICNYISLLGWSPPEGMAERFTPADLAANFTLDRIGKSNAKFDREKLFRFNGDALGAMPVQEFAKLWRDYCSVMELDYLKFTDADFARLAAAYHKRSRTLREPCDLARFFITPDDQIAFDSKSVDKVLKKDNGLGLLAELRPVLAAVEPFGAEAIDKAVHDFAAGKGVGLGNVAQPLRVAITGAAVSPPIGQTLEILGKAAVLARIDRCLSVNA